MIPDSIMNNADISREIRRALRTVRIKIKNGVADRAEPSSAQRPVNDSVMLIGGVHIDYILGIIYSPNRGAHAHKLTFLRQNISDISALTYSGKFPVRNICSIHNNGRHCSHSVESSIIPTDFITCYV